MHKSMEILMARMESHPEEFDLVYRQAQLNPNTRWDFVVKPLLARAESMVRGEPSFQLGFLSDKEISIVFRKLMSIQGDKVFKLISEELLRDDSDDSDDSSDKTAKPDRSNMKFRSGNRNIGE